MIRQIADIKQLTLKYVRVKWMEKAVKNKHCVLPGTDISINKKQKINKFVMFI